MTCRKRKFSEVDVEVPAKNKKEAREKLNDMLNNDRIRWEKAVVVDSGIKYNGMTEEERTEVDEDE